MSVRHGVNSGGVSQQETCWWLYHVAEALDQDSSGPSFVEGGLTPFASMLSCRLLQSG